MSVNLNDLKPIYFPSKAKIDEDLFFPVASVSKDLECMVGYFTSGSLSELALAFASFFASGQKNKMKLIISPNLTSDDVEAIEEARRIDKNLVPLLFPDFQLSEKTLKSDTLKAFAYLVASERLDIKVALMETGMFHTKCWIFHTELGYVAIHGSGNATKGGLASNFEQLIVSRSWKGADAAEICSDLKDQFENIWTNKEDGLRTVECNESTLSALKEIANWTGNEIPGSDKDFARLLFRKVVKDDRESERPVTVSELRIPEYLEYSSGEFAHQGEAVKSWMNNGYSGILAIATGGGKTITSLIGASLLTQSVGRLMIVVAVPTKNLLAQWDDDVREFGVSPINGLDYTRQQLKKEITSANRRLRHKISKNEVLIITHDALKSDVMDKVKPKNDSYKTMLIADEVHNLGALGFRANPPDFFQYRLGLSATYQREFDEEGTEFIEEFFGGLVFEYGLDDAIGSCLVPFEYYVQKVYLTIEEEEEFSELTEEIRTLSFAFDYSDNDPNKQRLQKLWIDRRRIVESAKNKVERFDDLICSFAQPLTRALVFCTDKDPEQLNDINATLNKHNIDFHQVTANETNKGKLLENILSDFEKNELRALTSKKVLDEGFNVPQTETAFLLASHKGKRQWIQRLGRILRKSPKTGKQVARVYDFVAMPVINGQAKGVDRDLQALLQSEYDRIRFFSGLSSNGLEQESSLEVLSELLEEMRGK